MVTSQEDSVRYARQMMLPGWGEAGQERIQKSTVFMAGAGGLGSPSALYMAAAGVGHLKVCDFDVVDFSNLNRQILHDPSRVGVKKVQSAKKTLEAQNPRIQVTSIETKIEAHNVDELVGDADLIIDGMDNFPTRYLLNECAIRKKIPLVYGSVWGLDGRMSFIKSPETPCLRCLFPDAPPKEVFPVLGATPGVIGCMLAMEALKYLAGFGENFKGKLLVWDGEHMEFQTLRVQRDPNCPTCAKLH